MKYIIKTKDLFSVDCPTTRFYWLKRN